MDANAATTAFRAVDYRIESARLHDLSLRLRELARAEMVIAAGSPRRAGKTAAHNRAHALHSLASRADAFAREFLDDCGKGGLL